MSQFRLARISLILAALGLNAAPALLTSAHAAEKPAVAATPGEVVRPDMFKLLEPAKTKALLDAKKFDEVQANIASAAALPNLTSFESYIVERSRLSLGLASKNDALTVPALEAMLKSEHLPKPERANFINALAGTYYEQKNYPKAIEWFKVVKAESAAADKGHRPLSRAYYLSQDYANAKAELDKLVAESEAANAVPSKEDLRLQLDVNARLKDRAGYAAVLEKLVANYPTDEYWTDLVRRIPNKPGFRPALQLDVFRLQAAVQKAMAADEYVEMTELALLGTFYTEAKNTMDAGFAKGVLGKGAEAGKQKALHEKANKAAADDVKNIAASDAIVRASKNGQGMVNQGYAYVTMGQFDKGIDLIEKGIAKGGLKIPEDAKLRLAEAYVKAGNKDSAIKAFEALKGNDGMTDLARLWIIFLKGPAVPESVAAPAPK